MASTESSGGTFGGEPSEGSGDGMLMDAGDQPGFSEPLLTAAAVMTFLIMIVGITGNLLTVYALLKCPKVRNVAAAFIISLCIADLLFCLLVLPFQGLRFVQGTWRHGAVLCRLIPFIQYGNIGVSLLCIAMITINRYVMITHHSYYASIYKRHWIAIMILACWLFSYGMQLPTLLGAWGRFGYDSRLQTCSIMSDRHGHSSKTTLFITAFVIPCLVIIACYAKIFWVVHKSEQRLKQHASKQNVIPNNLRTLNNANATPAGSEATPAATAGGAPASRLSTDSSSSYSTDVPETALPLGGRQTQPSRVRDQREVRAKRNEWRITKMVLAIFLSFVICYLPITIVKVADKNVEHPTWHIISYIMLYLSACINPIIYVIMNKQYRKAYKTVVLCKPKCLVVLPFTKSSPGALGGANSAAEKWKDAGLSNNHSRTLVSQMSAGGVGGGSGGASSSQTLELMTRVQSPAPATVPASRELDRERQPVKPGLGIPMPLTMPLAMPMSMQMLPSLTPAPPPPSVTSAVLLSQSQSQNATRSGASNRLPLKKNNHSYINNGFNGSNSSSGSPASGNTSSLYRLGGAAMNGQAPLRRITMVGDDIILEEEELPPTTPTSTDEAIAAAAATTTATPTSTPTTITTTTAAATTKTTPIYMNIASPKSSQFYSNNMRNENINSSASASANTNEQAQAGEELGADKVPNKLKIQKTNEML